MRTTVSCEAELAQAHALGVGVHADAVQGRHRVRRRVLDPAGVVEQDHAVADAGRLLAQALLAGEGELARRDHAGEAVEDLDVGALELAGMAHRRRRRLAGEHARWCGPGGAPGCTAPGPARLRAWLVTSPSMISPSAERSGPPAAARSVGTTVPTQSLR